MESLLVGVVVGRFGLRGEVKVQPETEFPERFERGAAFTWKRGAATRAVKVQAARAHKRQVVLKLEGVDTPDAADELRGGELHVPWSERRPLPAGSFYHGEIQGLAVFTEDGTFLGQVVDIWQPGGADVYVVGQPGERRWMIPAVSRFVHRIDVPAGRMIVTVEDGLRE
ncbi:MAG TPA: ribosome maturation factor RimM [Candidatus Xenobia bacterium]